MSNGTDLTDTDRRLLDAAYQVFSELGFRRATTLQIAKAANVNEVTLYRRYATKEALMVAAMEYQANRMIAILRDYDLPQEPKHLERDLKPYLDLILNAMIQAKQAHRTAIGEWGHHPAIDQYLLLTTDHVCQQVSGYFVRAAKAGLLKESVRPEVAAQPLLGAIFADSLMRDIMPARYPLSPERSVDAYLDVFLHGIAAT